MTLRDPTTRLWNDDRVRRGVGIVAWILALVLIGVTTYAFMRTAGDDSPWPAVVALAATIVLAVGGAFAMFTTDTEPTARWAVPIPAMFVAMGIGQFVAHLRGDRSNGDLVWISGCFVGCGLFVIVLLELFTRRAARRRDLLAHAARDGVTTRGVVVKRWRYVDDYQPVTRVTVRFTDRAGDDRWVRRSVAGELRVGAPVTVRYLPDEPGNVAAITVSPRR